MGVGTKMRDLRCCARSVPTRLIARRRSDQEKRVASMSASMTTEMQERKSRIGTQTMKNMTSLAERRRKILICPLTRSGKQSKWKIWAALLTSSRVACLQSNWPLWSGCVVRPAKLAQLQQGEVRSDPSGKMMSFDEMWNAYGKDEVW